MATSVLVRCDQCNTPIFSFVWSASGASLVFVNKHHGEKHVSIFPMNRLLEYVT